MKRTPLILVALSILAIGTLLTPLGGQPQQAQPVFQQSGAGAVPRTVNSRLAETVTVKDFGAKGDGVTDDTLAFARAITQAGAGGTVYVPRGKYVISSLSMTSAVTLQGTPWSIQAQDPFGHANWSDNGMEQSGTVLHITATSGIGISTAASGVHIRDIAIIGPGSGTSIGVQFQDANFSSLDNVFIANFMTGFRTVNMLDCTIKDLEVRGCGSGTNGGGIQTTSATNQNLWLNTRIQTCAGTALDYNGYLNTFKGLLIQANIGKGIVASVGGNALIIEDAWFENGVLGGLSGKAIDLQSGTGSHRISNAHFSYGTFDCNISIGASHCTLENWSGGPVAGLATFTNSGDQNYFLNDTGLVMGAATISSSGTNTTLTGGLTLGGGGILSVPGNGSFGSDVVIASASSGLSLNNSGTAKWYEYLAGGNDLYFRDLANSRMHAQLIGGGTNSTASSYFFSNVISAGDLTGSANFSVTGASNFTGQGTFNNDIILASNTSGLTFRSSGSKWLEYMAGGVNLNLRDLANGRMHVIYSAGSTDLTAKTDFHSEVNVFGDLSIGGGAGIKNSYSATATWDPISIADGSWTSTTVAVGSCALGDEARAAFSQAVPAGARLEANVIGAGTVTVSLFNQTGSALDLASGTLRASTWGR
jgi:hypothetical protein